MRDPYQLNAQGGIPQNVVFVILPNGDINLKASDCAHQCGENGCHLEEEHKEKHKPNYHPLLNAQRFKSILQGYGKWTNEKNQKRLINKALSNEANVQLWNQVKMKGNNERDSKISTSRKGQSITTTITNQRIDANVSRTVLSWLILPTMNLNYVKV